MGMFDSIIFFCPDCNTEIEEQSKSGDCLLKNYHHKSVPANIAMDIVDNTVICPSCKKRFIISGKIARTSLFLKNDSEDIYD